MENIQIETPLNLEIDCIKLQKMAFIYNAVQSGWEVKMKGGIYDNLPAVQDDVKAIRSAGRKYNFTDYGEERIY